MSLSARRGATLEDFWAIPEGERFHEFMSGEIAERAAPSAEHADAQAGVITTIRSRFQRKSGGDDPGGWWLLTEVEVLLETAEVVRPDVVGWRRDRYPERPTGIPVKQRPDWVCEVISASNSNNDTVRKLRLYHQVAIPYYWIVDPRDSTLTVMRWSSDGYITLLRAERGEVVRAEPFQAIEI